MCESLLLDISDTKAQKKLLVWPWGAMEPTDLNCISNFKIINGKTMLRKVIAHVRSADQKEQTLEQHLSKVSAIAGRLASKIGMKDVGELLGLMHDFGKYSQQFQNYIQSGTGILNMDIDDDWVDAAALKGKIDHSTAGAQWVWKKLGKYGANGQGQLCGQILALCIASHHSGLIDCLMPDGVDGFFKRMNKQDDKTNLEECIKTADKFILDTAHELAGESLFRLMIKQIKQFHSERQHGQKISPMIRAFYLGFWTRFLFSCLIDGDRIDSADFENPHFSSARSSGNESVNWNTPINRLEVFLTGLDIRNHIDLIRRDISNNCKIKSNENQGIYSLTVPTGGGKTYASLRFALHHAKKHQLDRIIYVIPYTSIIEQNADAIRKVIECEGDDKAWVLEHHSNLEPEQQTWRSKLVSENWDAPIVLTTMVQFLETLFSGGTRGVRRLHQLANSVIVFDEIQTLPIKCTHLFCNAINFLSAYARTTVVLCTATQPLLDKLKASEKGQLLIPKENELVKDTTKLFADLKRVNICNQVKTGGWNEKEIVKLILDEYNEKDSCLVIVNTKNWAQKLFRSCNDHVSEDAIFHLSTNQCPAHRKILLNKIRTRLDKELPVLCISTQLIEAGVDVDFACVIRFLAGLDSIAQAAGRCNRNGRLAEATVHVINPDQENIDLLPDIKIGQEKALRVFDENRDRDLLSPDKIRQYFEYYFYARSEEMSYTLTEKQAGRTDSLLNLLSTNPLNSTQSPYLKQSFMTAGCCAT